MRKYKRFAVILLSVAAISLGSTPTSSPIPFNLLGIGAAEAKIVATREEVIEASRRVEEAARADRWQEALEILAVVSQLDLNSYERGQIDVMYAEVYYGLGEYELAARSYGFALAEDDYYRFGGDRVQRKMSRIELGLENQKKVAEELASNEYPSAGNSPLVLISRGVPIYPRRALAQEVNGVVALVHAVNEIGLVEDVRIVSAEPTGYFERAAINGILKSFYKPAFVKGTPVRVDGIKNIVCFEIGEAEPKFCPRPAN